MNTPIDKLPRKQEIVCRFLHLLRDSGLCRGKIRKPVIWAWRRLGSSVVDATIHGVAYRLHIAENSTDLKILVNSRMTDRNEINALATGISDGGIFLDVGANTGHYSLQLARLGYARVVSVEPNPRTLEILRCNVALNDMEDKISIIPMCIGDGADVDLYCSGELGGASVVRQGSGDFTAVPSKPIVDIISDNNITKIGGLKIDVEGFEDRALLPFFAKAPRNLHPKVIVMEIAHRRVWQHDIIQELKNIGYQTQYKKGVNQTFYLAS